MRSAMGPVQEAIYPILATDAQLLAIVEAVVDAIPAPGTYRRFVYLGESVETPNNTFGGDGMSERLSIHSVAEDTQDASGWQLVKAANARVLELLDAAEIPVAGLACVFCHFESAQSIDDTPWRHIISDFRIETEAS